MPIYPYRCPTCGASQDAFNRVDDRDANAPVCCVPMERQLAAPMVSVPKDCHYVCPVTGDQVTSYRQRANIMAKEGLVDANDRTPDQVIAAKKKKTQERQKLAGQLPGAPPGITREQIFAEA